MASYFWAGVQGLISVPSLLQGLGAASVGKHMLFFFFLSPFGVIISKSHSQNASLSTFEEAAEYPQWKIPTSQRWCAWKLARACWPADQIARLSFAAKNFSPLDQRNAGVRFQAAASRKEKKKCRGWDESQQSTAGECKLIFCIPSPCLLCGPAAAVRLCTFPRKGMVGNSRC